MGLRINTNLESIRARRFLKDNRAGLGRAFSQLSSGRRINQAADDAAGLAISTKLRAGIRSMKQALRNAKDGMSLIQVAEGSLNEVANILVRLRELSIQAANDTVGPEERKYIDREVQALKSEIDRIANNTEFNDIQLLNGLGLGLELQVGINNNPLLDRLIYNTFEQNVTLPSLNLVQVGTATKKQAQDNLRNIDLAIERVSRNRSSLGALQNRLQSTVNNMEVYRENTEAANSRIQDADLAEITSDLVKQNILTQANISVLSHANAIPQHVLKLLN